VRALSRCELGHDLSDLIDSDDAHQLIFDGHACVLGDVEQVSVDSDDSVSRVDVDAMDVVGQFHVVRPL